MPKRHIPRDRFSTTEVAYGAGLTSRNVLYLCADGLIPVIAGGTGSGSHRQLDFEGLARVAVIAAFFQAGVEIYPAARLVHKLGEEASFHALANLESFLEMPRSGVIKGMKEDHLDPDNAFYLHDTLRRRSNNYRAHTAMAYDRLIEIFDRVYVFLNSLMIEDDQDAPVPGHRPICLYKLGGWKRGSDAIEIAEVLSYPLGRVPSELKTARTNFRGMIRINVSLVIRDTLDAISARRGS